MEFAHDGESGLSALSDDEIVELADDGCIQSHALERLVGDAGRAVSIRRSLFDHQTIPPESKAPSMLHDLPWQHYDYNEAAGRCAENVLGYLPVPLGVAGPLIIDGIHTYLPMSTTEGTLVASTSRGCKALNAAGGANTELLADAMTRAPCIRFIDIRRAASAKRLLDSPAMQSEMRCIFETTTRHGRMIDVVSRMAGNYLYLRFRVQTGDAMGMNMLSKGSDAVLRSIRKSAFPDMEIVTLSGNYCSDKKPAAVNWIEGRGKSVVAESIVPPEVLRNVLKTTAERLAALNTSKNLVGSALAGVATGGFNAHAANIVTAMFLATGQDIAQVVTSSNCMTMMERTPQDSLHITVTMPSIEVGTIGGGTELTAQASMLRLIGCGGTAEGGGNSKRLASIIAAAVLAGELSLCSALASGDLVNSHLKLNRK